MKKYVRWVLVIATITFLCGCAGQTKQSYVDSGMEALMQQDYQTALSCFEQARLAGEDLEMVYRGIGLTCMGRQEYAKAVSAFQMALSHAGMFPGDLEYDINYYMAISYYKLDEYVSAISCYDAIINLVPRAYDAYYLRGSMKLYLDDVEGAIADFDAAVAINDDYGMYINIYDCLRQHGYTDQAQEYMNVVLMADGNGISDYDKGRLSYFQGEYAAACNFLERARSNEKPDAQMIALLGECYKKEGQYDYAAVVYSGYVEEYADPEIYNQLGLCYVEQGEYELALTAFQNGIAIEENNTCMQTLKLNEIACYEYLHDFSTAAQLLNDYMQIYPVTAELEREYAFLTTR